MVVRLRPRMIMRTPPPSPHLTLCVCFFCFILPFEQILFRQGPLANSQLKHVSFRGDANGVAIRGVLGEEEAWLKGDREEWLDHLLSLLLPLVEYVETKQSLQMNLKQPPPKFVS